MLQLLGSRAGRVAGAIIVAQTLVWLASVPVVAALTTPQRAVLATYLAALQRADYARAYAVLTPADRRYFGSAANYASIFRADRFRLDGYRIVASTKGPAARAVVAFVSERVRFFDHAHQVNGSATVRVPYELVSGSDGPSVNDPLHPWRAFAPVGASAIRDRLRVTIRKVSFFTGRMEIVATFQNLGDKAITVLPFLRSSVRDESGTSHAPLATRLPDLTDKTLYVGLALPGSGQYTGAINFRTAERYAPKRLSLVLAPALVDGGDAPFEVALPPIAVPPAA